MPSLTLGELPPPPTGKTGWPWTETAPPPPPNQPNGEPWPHVTIVTPSYNQADYLEETIRSVLLQGYPNLEYFIIDGGSTDGSVEIIQRYAAWLDWWVSEPDEGQSYAINKGFERATGEIVAWLNSDDVYTPCAIVQSVEYLLAHPEVSVVYGDVTTINQQSIAIGEYTGAPFDIKRFLTSRNFVPQQCLFIRRAIIDQVGLLRTDLHYVMDWEWWLRIAVGGGNLAYLPGTRAWFRSHGDAKSTAQWLHFIEEQEQEIKAFYARPDLPAEYREWEQLVYGNVAIYHGAALVTSGKRRKALRKLWAGLRPKPWRPHAIMGMLIMLDALFGLPAWHWAAALRRRLAGEKTR